MDPSGLPSYAPEILSPKEIRALRLKCRLTQQELARRLNVRRETIVRWEKGRQVPNPVYVELLRKIEAESLRGNGHASTTPDSKDTDQWKSALHGKCPICGQGPLRPVAVPLAQQGTQVATGILAYQCVNDHIFFVMAKDIKQS